MSKFLDAIGSAGSMMSLVKSQVDRLIDVVNLETIAETREGTRGGISTMNALHKVRLAS